MVTTFELDQGRRLPDAQNMNAASAQLPQGAYTTFRTYAGNRVLRLAQHLRRLEESAALMGSPGALDDAAVARGLSEALRATGFPESRFRLTFAPPHCFISVEPFAPYPAELYEQGVWCVTLTVHRDNPHAKNTAFIASAGDAYKALPPGAHEGLMVAADGAVLEGLSSNFFALLDGVLHTERARALVGVTQSLALEVAQAAAPGVAIATQAVRFADLPRLNECFITSVSREILPVVKIDDHVIGAGTPGPVTRELMRALRELIERESRPVRAA
jgi:branched-chain amino acid aminotransferase